MIVPDFVANAGGVISSWAEYAGKDQKYMYRIVKDKLMKNTEKVLSTAEKLDVSPRKAAEKIALDRIKAAMTKRDKLIKK